MAAVVVGLLCLFGAELVVGAPARTKTYDQRQQGELNIHAQLDNIVIVVIPSSKLNLLGLKKFSEKPGIDKESFLQFFQKPHKAEIDRYETVNEDSDAASTAASNNDITTDVIDPVISSQQVALNHEEKKGEKNEDKEEEVVATVKEMTSETNKKETETPQSDALEDNPGNVHSTVDDTVQESTLTISIPEELMKAAEQEASESFRSTIPENDSKKEPTLKTKPKVIPETIKEIEKESPDKVSTSEVKESFEPVKKESHESKKSEETPAEPSEPHSPTIEDLIKPVASKKETPKEADIPKKTTTPEEPSLQPTAKKSNEPLRLVEGVRKEKVIRYKPENKWAPELVDLLGPPKPKTRELEERQRFSSLCAPGVWDTELKTCIMPGETRSRAELARFLEAMRFGIAVPSQ